MSINPTIKTGSSYDSSKFVLGDALTTGETILLPILSTKERILLGNTFLIQDKITTTVNKNAPSINIGYTVYDSDEKIRYTWNSSIWVALNTTTASQLTVLTPDGQLQTAVNISSTEKPQAGQVLMAVSNSQAKWMDSIGVTGSGGGGGTFPNPMTTTGDIIVGGPAGTPTRLPVNTTTVAEVLTSHHGGTDWLSFNTLLQTYNIKPALNYVGIFDHEPTHAELGSLWVQNALYKNSVDGKSYILTGDPLAWIPYIEDGFSFYLAIESSNGTAFKVGLAATTMLKARLFKNGAEITEQVPSSWFSWRRVSAVPKPYPDDDTTWNGQYSSGYKQIYVTVDDVYARATFFCDIIV